jgi:hypothetical protein
MFIQNPGSRIRIRIRNTALYKENLQRTTLRTVSEIFQFEGFVAQSWQTHGNWKKQNILLSLLKWVEFLEGDE